MTTTETISIADFARRVGTSRQAVHSLVKRGRLTSFGSPPRLHLELALVEYGRLRPRSPNAASDPDEDDPADAAPRPGIAYQAARARREEAEAALAQMRARRAAGELLLAAEVFAVVADVGATLRSELESWTHRLAPLLAPCAGDERRVAAVVAVETERLQSRLSAIFAALAEAPARAPNAAPLLDD